MLPITSLPKLLGALGGVGASSVSTTTASTFDLFSPLACAVAYSVNGVPDDNPVAFIVDVVPPLEILPLLTSGVPSPI